MHHRPGKTMGKSNALSWRSDHSSGSKDNDNMVLLTPDFFVIQALEGLEVWGEEKDILGEIWCKAQSRSKEEVVVKAIKGLMKSSAKSVKSSEWSLDNGILYHRGKIYIPNSNLCCCISTLCHETLSLLAIVRISPVALWLRSEMDPYWRDLTNILLSYLISDSFGPVLGARAWSCKTTNDYLCLSRLRNTSEIFGERCFRLPPGLLMFYITFLLYGSMGLTILDHIYSSFL